MTKLFIDEISDYYYSNAAILTEAKRFHFASRMFAWNGDPKARRILETTRDFLLPSTDTATIKAMLQSLLSTQQTGKRNAHELRSPFFAKYPDLYGLQLALFRVRHLKYIYGIDTRREFESLYPTEKIVALKDSLLNDPDALKYLSTFAVNFCYLTDIVILEQRPSFSIERLYNLGDTYDTNNINEIQLLLYFYTHCIICETNFYIDPLSGSSLPLYKKMLVRIENIISENFDRITLDNKLEYLVATKICQGESPLEGRIYDECRASISPAGNFIIDIHNANKREERRTFDKSEHRNTLLIMSSMDFKPTSDIIVPQVRR